MCVIMTEWEIVCNIIYHVVPNYAQVHSMSLPGGSAAAACGWVSVAKYCYFATTTVVVACTVEIIGNEM